MPLLILTLVQVFEIFLYGKELLFCYLLCDKYLVYDVYNLIFLSRVIQSSSTVSNDLMVVPSKDITFFNFNVFVLWKS